MAKNGVRGGGRRGAIRNRLQFRLPNGHYAKRNRATGEILSVKADRTPYKGVVIERDPSPALIAAAMASSRRAPRGVLPAFSGRPAWFPRPAAPARPAAMPQPIVEFGGEERAAA